MFNNNNTYSYIGLCKVPITPVHTIDFKSKTEQYNYFKSHEVVNYPKCRYTPRTGTIKVKGYVDDLNTCNYGYYSNTYKGTSKNYYFFIAEKNAVSKEVTELTIQIDVIQTWLFDFSLKPCFIERTHTLHDEIGTNTFPESFELGEYVAHDRLMPECLTKKPAFYLATTEDVQGGIFGATYSGFKITEYAYEDIDQLNTQIQKLCDDGKADSIAFLFTFPSGLLRGLSSGSTLTGYEGVLEDTVTIKFKDLCDNFIFNGQSHKPYNNKLYVYPFNFFTIKSGNSNVVLKFESFKELNNIQFKVESVLTQNPTITITPLNYNGKDYAVDDSISLNDYGLCSWNNDNYSNWFANHKNSIEAQSTNARASFKVNNTVANNSYMNNLDNISDNYNKSMISTIANTLGNVASLNFGGAIASAGTGHANANIDKSIAQRNATNDLNNSKLLNKNTYQNEMRSLMASVKDASVQPNTARGYTGACGLDIARGTASFIIEHTMIRPEYARMIDMYFQAYGYQVNTIEVPCYTNRQKWNYVKTLNCNAVGNIPFADLQEIENTFNNGITFWHKEEYMYNYNQENSIVSGV